MRYVTTNIRLPEELWKSLKMEAAHQGRRLSEIIRQRLAFSLSYKKMKKTPAKVRSLRGVWKGVEISEELIQEAKQSLFPHAEKFLSH